MALEVEVIREIEDHNGAFEEGQPLHPAGVP